MSSPAYEAMQSQIWVAELLHKSYPLDPDRQATFDTACDVLSDVARLNPADVAGDTEAFNSLLKATRVSLLVCAEARGSIPPSLAQTREHCGFTDMIGSNQTLSVDAYQEAGSDGVPSVTCLQRHHRANGYLAVMLRETPAGVEGIRVRAQQLDRGIEGFVSAVDAQGTDNFTQMTQRIRREAAFTVTAVAITAALQTMHNKPWQQSPVRQVLDMVPILGFSPHDPEA